MPSLMSLLRYSSAHHTKPHNGFRSHPLAEYHFVPAVSVRNALYREATCWDSPLHFYRWNIDSHHISDSGHQLMAALMHHWFAAQLSSHHRPSDTFAYAAEATAGAAERAAAYGGASVGGTRQCDSQCATIALCFSFDDTFEEFESDPDAPADHHGGPLLAATTDCFYREMQNSSHGLLRKPGYACIRQGQTMILNTTVRAPAPNSGRRNDGRSTLPSAPAPTAAEPQLPWQVRVGYLKTSTSRAAASFACRGGCTCKRVNVSAFSRGDSLLSEGRLRAHAVAGRGFCLVEVLVTKCDHGDAFKLISLTVSRRGSCRTSNKGGWAL